MVPKKPDQPGQYANSHKYQGSARAEMCPEPAAGLLPFSQNHGMNMDESYSQCVDSSFMYYHKAYHGGLGIPMPCSLGSPDQAFQITVLPCDHLHPGTGTSVTEPSPAPRTPSALHLSLQSVLESGFAGDAIWGRKVPLL